MRKGWINYRVTYDNNIRDLNSQYNAIQHAYSLAGSYQSVTVTAKDKLLVQWTDGELIYVAPSVMLSLGYP